MKKYLLYGYGGAYNHGAEAIVRTTVNILRNTGECQILLSTHFPDQDRQFGIDKLVDCLIPAELQFVAEEKAATSFREKERIAEKIYRRALATIDENTVCLAVGGDNYCYANWHRQAIFHRTAKSRGGKSILWCCSIQPEMMDEEMLQVLSSHDQIYPRESCTLQTLTQHGIIQNVHLLPDPAFLLSPEPVALPEGFFPGRTAAVNLSPLLLRRNPEVLDAFVLATQFLLKKTETVLLVPHVTMPMDNDVNALHMLAERLSSEERKRICQLPDSMNAAQLKYIISQCAFMLCCRTHASIAAYSSGVPTVVVGYSVKSHGIGKDLGMQDYVIPAKRANQLPAILNQAWDLRPNICNMLHIFADRRNEMFQLQ